MSKQFFCFRLGEDVMISISGETGTVIGRAEYQSMGNQYQLRYQANNGGAVEKWWDENALNTVE